MLSWHQSFPGQVAYRLEQIQAEAEGGMRGPATVQRLLRTSDYSLVEGDLRKAVFSGLAAQRLAFDECNPAGLELARAKLAAAWLPVAAKESDDWTLSWTAYFVGCSRADVKDEVADERIRPLKVALETHEKAAFKRGIVRLLTEDAVGRVETRGMILLLADLRELITPLLLESMVVPMIERSLREGWLG